MKRKGVLLALAVLVLGLMAAPALGNTVTMTQDHSLTVGLTGDANLAFSGYDAVFTYSSVQGSSSNLTTSEGPVTGETFPSASVSGTYFNSTATVGGYTGSGPYTMSQSMVADAPGAAGITSQITQTHISLIFVADSDGGTAQIAISDVLSNNNYSASGPIPPFFTNVTANTLFTASFFTDIAYPSGDVQQQTLLDDVQNLPNAPLFTGSINQISNLTFVLNGLSGSEQVYLDLDLYSTLDTASAVPVPPTLLLFGSGLGGLLLLGRRRKFWRS